MYLIGLRGVWTNRKNLIGINTPVLLDSINDKVSTTKAINTHLETTTAKDRGIPQK